jgi:tetratricopeptide (TPR) repeat protein
VAPADEVPDLPAATPPAPAATPAAPPSAKAEAPPPTDPTELARVSNEVMQAYLAYRRKDSFDMLELGEDAGNREIEERFLDLSARFNPGRFASPDLAPVAEKARDVFLALARAYGELADLELRKILVGRRRTLREQAALRPPPDFTIKTDLLDPDVQYKKGVALAEAGHFREALQQLEFACDCDPGNGAYRAEAARCRFRLAPSSFAHKALGELDEALRIDPGCGIAAFYAGEIHVSLGNRGQAEGYFRRAIKPMSPDRRPIDALKNLTRKS